MRWVDTTDLKNWAFRRDCQEDLPLVVRRLIRATTLEGLSKILFPAGDSVQYGGWDGTLRVTIGTEYIPEGESVWEFGTSQDIKKKAENDYKKRRENTLGIEPSTSTYVFVTPRIWSNKDEWSKEKQKESFWKEVRVYDAETLEEWLEQAPAVGAWLAKRINIFPEGVCSADNFWNEWSSATVPHITSELVLSGREKQVELVRKWLGSDPSLLTVKAASSEDALVFLIAAAGSLSETEKDNFFSRCLIVNDVKSFRSVSVTRNSLFLVNSFEETDSAINAVQNKHHVYFPIGADNSVTKENILLPRLERETYISALKDMGLTEHEAKEVSKETGRSLSVLRRKLSAIPSQPKWAQKETARDILPALLIGRWMESKSKVDKEIISRIAGESYGTLCKKLTAWLNVPDSPLYKIGNSWRLTSPMDALFALGPYLSSEDLESFKGIALEVLGTVKPCFDLELEKRWMASVYGKDSPHSGWLREGIAQTLVLIAVFGDGANIQTTSTPQTWVNNIVYDLLNNADWKKWSSLTDVLSLIAEASPISFLDSVEKSLAVNEPPIMGMFSEINDTTFSNSSHTGLLWALEELAWDPFLLGRVTVILGKLAKLDPGGQTLNRPARSLRDIFLLWLPQTYASLNKRLSALNMLLDRQPKIGWSLLLALVPQTHGMCIPTYKARWRQPAGHQDNTVTYAEISEGVTAIKDKLIKHVGFDGYRWAELIKETSNFHIKDREDVVKYLLSVAEKIDTGRDELWNTLRKVLSLNHSFHEAKWALPKSVLIEIEKAYFILEPSDIYQRFSWLFDSYNPELPEGRNINDINLQEETIKQRRKEAVKTIKDAKGIEGLILFSRKIKFPELMGPTTSQINLTQEEEGKLFPLLIGDNKETLNFVQSYFSCCAYHRGNDWIGQIVEKSQEHVWPLNNIVNFLVALPENSDTWKNIETYNSEVKNEYWKKCRGGFFHTSSEDKVFGIRKLFSVGRYFTALGRAALIVDDLPISLVFEILQKAALNGINNEGDCQLDAHHVVRLFERLAKTDDLDNMQMAELEWAYLPLLADEWTGVHPRILHKELSNDPAFFAEIIKWTYKSRDDNSTQEMVQRARLGHKLLSSWKTVPGSSSEGQIDYEELLKWVCEARRLCTESGRSEVGDSSIGQVFAYSKAEEDKWPPEPICRVIDKIESSDLGDGFCIAINNKRGVTTRSPFEGGNQERELAVQFRKYAENLYTSYPRTAALLVRVAEGYEDEAKGQDKEAERRDLDY